MLFDDEALRTVVRPDRYKVVLPDSYTLYENVDLRGLSNVCFVLDEFPEWVQRKYSKREKGWALGRPRFEMGGL